MKISLITSPKEKLKDYFPTNAEPDFKPSEAPFTPDDQILVNHLRKRGHEVNARTWGTEVWNEKNKADLFIMRSPWDYMDTKENRFKFLQWLSDLKNNDVKIENSVDFMTWLLDKKYLIDIQKQGVNVVPSEYVTKSSPLDLLGKFANEGPLIVKPALSAAGVGLEVLDSKEKVIDYSKKFGDLIKLENYIVQPLIESIKTEGEWSLIFIAGNYSHSIHKAPKQADIMVHAERGGSLNFKQAPIDLVEEASEIIPLIQKAYESQYNKVNYMPLYLRCDFIKDSTQDKFLLSECEGVEPELFFRAKPGSETAFVDALENSK